jgi:hypothetical protein
MEQRTMEYKKPKLLLSAVVGKEAEALACSSCACAA